MRDIYVDSDGLLVQYNTVSTIHQSTVQYSLLQVYNLAEPYGLEAQRPAAPGVVVDQHVGGVGGV